jgi:hypothetical protein
MTIRELLKEIATFNNLDQPVTLRMRTVEREAQGFPIRVHKITDFDKNWAIGDTGNLELGLCISFDSDRGKEKRL